MKDIMLDLETFGNGKRACICQIGACRFNRFTGEIGETFKMNVDARDAMKAGAEIDADTVYWWLAQSDAARKSIAEAPLHSLAEALGQFNTFAKDCEAIWSHATFDFVILTESFRMIGLRPAFSYRSGKDIRTLIDLAGTSTKPLSRTGVHHDGLDDCFHQVKYCVEAFQKLASTPEADK